MTEFFVGQKVVCVNDGPLDNDPSTFGFWAPGEAPKVNAIYTVTGAFTDPLDDGLCLQFVEIKRCVDSRTVPGYSADRFRPLESKAIELFRAIAAAPQVKISEAA